MKKQKSVGLFFGSFNPVHIGHLMLADFFTAYSPIDELWFVISPHNPLKEQKSLLDDHHRLHMLRLAVEDFPQYKVCTIEFSMPKPSYTIHTIVYLKEKYPDKKFVLLMGSDSLETLNKWKNYQQLLEEVNILVYPRPGYNGGEFAHHPSVRFCEAPLIEISSSFIRKALSEKKKIPNFLPPKVARYIEEMHFYEKPST